LGRPADTPQWGRSHAPIKSRRSALTLLERHNACPPTLTGGTERRSQLQQAQDPNLRNTNVAVLSTLTLRANVRRLPGTHLPRR